MTLMNQRPKNGVLDQVFEQLQRMVHIRVEYTFLRPPVHACAERVPVAEMRRSPWIGSAVSSIAVGRLQESQPPNRYGERSMMPAHLSFGTYYRVYSAVKHSADLPSVPSCK